MGEILYSTSDLSKMLQVGSSTIKRWTEEGKLRCFRTPGGHRKFKSSEVNRFLAENKYEVNQENVLRFPPQLREVKHTSPIVKIPDDISEQLYQCSIKGKKAELVAMLLDLQQNGKSLPSIFDQSLVSVLHNLQQNHNQHTLSPVEFQIARDTLFSTLVRLEGLMKFPSEQKKEVYCITTGDGLHEIELKALELELLEEGIKVFNLGSALSAFTAEELIAQFKPDDVFVVASSTQHNEHFKNEFVHLKNGIEAYGGSMVVSSFSKNNDDVTFFENASTRFVRSYKAVVDLLGKEKTTNEIFSETV